jgi:hypothetical protein
MAEERAIHLIHSAIDKQAALELAAPLSSADQLHIERALYYPYYHFSATCQVPTLFAKQALTADCLVDGRQGVAATADAFEVTTMSAEPASVLQSILPLTTAEQVASRYMSHLLTRKTRSIARFDVELEFSAIVHKEFWLLRCGQDNWIIDGVTGQVHPMSRAA